VYQLILLPAEVAFNCDDEPQLSDAGVADTLEGRGGGVILTTTATLVGLGQLLLFASA
jgi:hypothetical protein